MAQIIDENANISENLENYLDSIGISKAGLNYHTLSIIGCQSSGKSTLLNALFHTTFATMNEEIGRQQTTKGIHAAFNDQNVLIFDIEGSDSRERGDTDALFERKAALFGIALSEVVMVNMWENDIGRYNASSIPLLRTVFEVNLQLFASSHESKCHLLFVIRDATQKDEIIMGQVRRDLDLIWRELVLPPGLQGKKFEDFFVFHFFSLPHLRLKPEEFKASAAKLAAKFTDPEDPDFFFSQPMGKLIPGDGLYQYINSVWEAISSNKELNLPSQRKTLSNFRCEEFMNESYKEFEESLKTDIAEHVGKKVLEDFHERAEKVVNNALDKYNSSAGKYMKEVVTEKRNMLRDKISSALLPLFTENCKLFKEKSISEFNSYIKEMSDILEETEGMEQKALDKKNETVKNIKDFVEKSVVSDFKWECDLGKMEEELAEVVDKKIEKAQKDMEIRIYTKRSPMYKERINELLEKAETNMWEEMRAEMSKEINEAKEEVNEILKKSTISRTVSHNITSMYHKTTVTQVLTASEFVPQKMSIRFEEKFLQDENHKSREWGPEDDIPAQFEVARDCGMNVLKMFTNCQLREPGTPIPSRDILTKEILTPIKVQAIESEFNEAIEKNYYTAVQIKESKIVRNDVPLWMWIIIAITGYQKLVAAIRHPFVALFLVTAIGFIFYLYKLGKLAFIIKKVKDFLLKMVSMAVTLLKHNTNELELPPSIKENERKSATLDKEAIKQGIDPNEKLDDSFELSTIDSTIDSQKSSIHESDLGDIAQAPVRHHRKKRKSGKADRFSTIQAGKIDINDIKDAVKKRNQKYKNQPADI